MRALQFAQQIKRQFRVSYTAARAKRLRKNWRMAQQGVHGGRFSGEVAISIVDATVNNAQHAAIAFGWRKVGADINTKRTHLQRHMQAAGIGFNQYMRRAMRRLHLCACGSVHAELHRRTLPRGQFRHLRQRGIRYGNALSHHRHHAPLRGRNINQTNLRASGVGLEWTSGGKT